ncbi:MAG TPA: NTPase [Thermoplasmatales archaeon]|nr:NTPase [Thermoplasmatales archaeon]
MSLIPKIGITGAPRVGKTEGIIKVIGRLEDIYNFGGMITKSIEENGVRVGFKIIDWITKEEKIFAHVNFDTPYRVGKYKVDLRVLNNFGIPAIEKAIYEEEIDIVVIDEVGKMELESKKFKETVREALECEKPVLLTLHKKSRDSLLQDIRNMSNVRILEITSINRNFLPYKIEKLLKEEWRP